MRIDRLLQVNDFGSKSDRKHLFQRKIVTVDQRVITDGSINVDPGLQVIKVGNHLITGPQEYYWMMNKPAGYVTANKDITKPVVFDLLQAQDRHPDLYSLGRLDRFTEGLLILTTNGPLSRRLLQPHQHVAKTYAVEVNGFLGYDQVQAFAQGIVIDQSYQCQPAQLQIIQAGSSASRAQVTLHEGKFHQVKKMFLSLGVKVTQLKRLSFAGIDLDPDLAPGQYRVLKADELALIKAFLGPQKPVGK